MGTLRPGPGELLTRATCPQRNAYLVLPQEASIGIGRPPGTRLREVGHRDGSSPGLER